MKAVPAATIAAFLALGAPGDAFASDDGPYGAISYSDRHESSYFVTDYPSEQSAEAAALKNCRDEDATDTTCRTLLTFHNACGSFAEASNGAFGTSWGTSEALAEMWAVDTCQKYGGADCKPSITACSPGGAMTIHGN